LKFDFAILLKAIVFLILTALTQIGGIVYLISNSIARKLKLNTLVKRVVLFLSLYSISTFILVPSAASFFGREKVKHSSFIKPTNYMTVILNRNYVIPDVNLVLKNSERELKGTGIQINYLDANFPFIIGFPLLPHLSHNDGRKLDLSLVYQSPDGEISTKQKSRSGYGIFEEPKHGEFNQIAKCKINDFYQYDYSKYLSFGTKNDELIFSPTGTKALINSLIRQPQLEKLFIEPHLKTRLNLHHDKVRYHGCKAVRHDDHIHFQVK
jgi:hypothetical protein